MVDQMIQDHPTLIPISDTTLVYASVLKKHKYSIQDFQRALAHHLKKPEDLKKMVIPYRDQMNRRKEVLQKEINDAKRKRETLPYSSRFFPIRSVAHPFSLFADSTVIQNLYAPDTVRTQIPQVVRNATHRDATHRDTILPIPKVLRKNK